MTSQHGFTLIETLITLSITITLLSLGFSVQIHVLDEYKTKKFFEMFESDMLYLQQLSVTNQEYAYMTISPTKNSYTIKKGGFGTVLRNRKIPDDWNIILHTLSMPISFSYYGNIKKPGMFTLETKTKLYAIYCPLGKGRCYVKNAE
ncbi:competence type IV pilus minor pilin ComGD [Radiobacillus sp. PE A8.2]|uniref:competence type IV pilus minor pilin ComGD n=1 Tax=Radiobacillus sp. PE A8.2 TaxID=3380349 RepID=UPI00388D5940